ncbi:hypothetical protein C8Q75DRAFT_767707 [Abortiporus biennis]|nr:hypothetical protein C8Q75DRAFT_767707 [Abortiporus biennis]
MPHCVCPLARLPDHDRPSHPIVFLNHHRGPPSLHPRGSINAAKPDFLAVKGPPDLYDQYLNPKPNGGYLGIPYPLALSTGEAKPRKNQSRGALQAITYTCEHLEACPNLVGVFALSVGPKRYQVVWSDPGGVVVSQEEEWNLDNMPLLLGYLFSLYCPRDDHISVDTSIEFTPRSVLTGNPPDPYHWTIRCSDGEVYTNCERVVVGGGWGDRVNIFTAGKDGSEYYIKEAYHHPSRRFREDKLQERIHEEGPVPGVAELVHFEVVSTEHNNKTVEIKTVPTTMNEDAIGLQKLRLVFKFRAEPLWKVESLHDFFKLLFDLCEVHRWLANEREILHRNLNILTVLSNLDHPGHGKPTKPRPQSLKLIDDIIKVYSEPPGIARCLLLDFHNAASLNPSDVSNPSYALSTSRVPKASTPLFAARAISLGHNMTRGLAPKVFIPMPELDGRAKALYIEAFGQSTYDEYLDKGTVHGGHPQEQPTIAYCHRMDHDAESIFWIMTTSLLRFQPADHSPDDESALNSLARNWSKLERHSIIKDPDELASDERSALLGYSADSWRHILHPALRECAPLIYAMQLHVTPEYAYLDKIRKDDHLHEAFRRILLHYLVKMDEDEEGHFKDVKLDTLNLRPVTIPKKGLQIGTTKRKAQTTEDENKAKKRKSTRKQPASVPIWNQRTLEGG